MLASLPRHATGTSPSRVLEAGASRLEVTFGTEAVRGIQKAYMVGIKDAWVLTLALCGAAVLVALAAPRVSISGKMGASADKAKEESQTASDDQKAGQDEKEVEKDGGGSEV